MLKKLITTLLMSGLNLFPFGISVQAEVIQEYNEFSGETMVMSLSKEWDEKTPTLFLNTTFQGKKNEEVPSLMFFSVEEIYTLSPKEQNILREYTAIVLNSDIWTEQ